ncbi:MAG: hypothetical protein ACLFPF_09885 [Halanaerobiales bacterium]
MRIEAITREQVMSLRKTLSGVKKTIEWDKIDYELGRGVVNKTKYCLWTTEGKRIEISVTGRGINISQSEREDPEYIKLKSEVFKN